MCINQRFVFLFAVTASLVGCAENPAEYISPETPTVDNGRATVAGHVLDTQGAPIAGVAVAVRTSGEHTTTDATGAFTLDVPANTLVTT